jgi:hypothetical protein
VLRLGCEDTLQIDFDMRGGSALAGLANARMIQSDLWTQA